MVGEIEDEEALTFDVGFALRDVPILRSQQERRSQTWRHIVAQRIVAHLRRTNWIIRRGTALHATSATAQETGAGRPTPRDG